MTNSLLSFLCTVSVCLIWHTITVQRSINDDSPIATLSHRMRCKSWSVEVCAEACVVAAFSNGCSVVFARKHGTPLYVCMFIMQSTAATNSECAETQTYLGPCLCPCPPTSNQSHPAHPRNSSVSHQKAHIIKRLSQRKCLSPVYPVHGCTV